MSEKKPVRDYFTVGIALKNIHDEILLIKEAKASTHQPDDHAEAVATENSTTPPAATPATEHDSGKWRLPCSNLHKGDDLPSSLESVASIIGTKLTGYDFDTQGICYINLHKGPSVIVIYVANQPYGPLPTDPPDPEEVAAVDWFAYDEILQLNKDGLLRDPEVTLTAVENVQNGITAPLEIIAD